MKQQKLSIDAQVKLTEAYIVFSKISAKFIYEEIQVGENKSIQSIPKHVIVVILEGEVLLNCNEFVNTLVCAGQMFFCRNFSSIGYLAKNTGEDVVLAFDMLLSEYDEISGGGYKNENPESKFAFPMLEVNNAVRHFVDFSLYWFKRENLPVEFMEIKHKELL